MLAKIPTQQPPKEFLNAFSVLAVPKGFEYLTNAWREHRDTIRSFLAQANGFEAWSHRTAASDRSTSRAKPSRFESDPASPGDPDDPDTRRWPEGQIGILTAALPDEIRKAAIDCDIDEAELADQREYYLVSSKGKSALQQLAVHRAIAARGQYRHIRMQHQLLPFEYSIPALRRAPPRSPDRPPVSSCWRCHQSVVAAIAVMHTNGVVAVYQPDMTHKISQTESDLGSDR